MSKFKFTNLVNSIKDSAGDIASRVVASTVYHAYEIKDNAKEIGKEAVIKGLEATGKAVNYMREEGFDKVKEIAQKTGETIIDTANQRIERHDEYVGKYEDYSDETLIKLYKSNDLNAERKFAIRAVLDSRGYFEESK